MIALGSSSVEPGSPLVLFLEIELQGAIEARGVRGSRVASWVERARGENVRGQAVIVLLGGNDSNPRAEDVRAIDTILRARGADGIAWLPPPAYLAASRAAGRDRAMRRALADARVSYVRAPVRLARAEYGSDLVHPTRAGYARWAHLVGPELRTILTRPSSPSPSSAGPALAVAALAVLAWRA